MREMHICSAYNHQELLSHIGVALLFPGSIASHAVPWVLQKELSEI